MTPLYCDSSFLVQLYLEQEMSLSASRFLVRGKWKILFSPLHELELTNAIQRQLFLGKIEFGIAQAALLRMKQDVDEEILSAVFFAPLETFSEANRLALKFTGANGCRSLDLLHVASALVLKSKFFATFDQKQAALATKAGLKVSLV